MEGLRAGETDGAPGPAPILRDFPVPAGHSSFEWALAIVEGLVKEHSAVVTETDLRADCMTITMRIPRTLRLEPPV
jgi:hypothetical protein